jgi:hypothetical protein
MPTYKSIALAPGESYVLPAGATVISVSNSVIYASENNCAPLTNVEPLGCYMAAIGAYSQDDAGATYGESISGNNAPLVAKGIYQNGIYTPFTTGDMTGLTGGDLGCFNGIEMGNKIKELIPGIMAVNGTAIPGSTTALNNCLTFIQIQTVPSLAENLYIWMAHSVSLQGGNPGGTDFVIPFKTYDYWASIPGLTGIPGPCTTAP